MRLLWLGASALAVAAGCGGDGGGVSGSDGLIDSAVGDSVQPADAAPPADAIQPIDAVLPADATSDAGPPACDPADVPDDATGFYVSPSGVDSTADGTRVRPFHTIALALTRAISTQRAYVYLDTGTYLEQVNFVNSDPGIQIEGGWTVTGTTWTRDCGAGARDLTVIAAPTAIAVTVTDLTQVSGLSNLTVQTKAMGATASGTAAAESLVGILVRGTGTHFRLDNINVLPGTAAAGGAPTSGSLPDPTVCAGAPVCDSGLSGTMPSAGTPATRGYGSFSPSGYAAEDGQAGTMGTPGHNGTMGSTATGNCSQCGSVISCTTSQVQLSSTGACGCGGNPGGGGGAGHGGAGSFGVIVVGTGAVVDVVGSTLRSGAGGQGGPGGAGAAPGGTGTNGSAGTAITCGVGTCSVQMQMTMLVCTTAISTTLTGGPGGPGGRGGAGSDGGAGAGGPSVPLVTTGGATASVDPTSQLLPGTPGQPGGAGAAVGSSVPLLAL
jgi:hypothetical protein